jgi:hypothetical protein
MSRNPRRRQQANHKQAIADLLGERGAMEMIFGQL